MLLLAHRQAGLHAPMCHVNQIKLVARLYDGIAFYLLVCTVPTLGCCCSRVSGCLPAWKSLIERLFQRGLLKVVFATGTLAAGINMPARTTLISQLSRKTDDGIHLLPHNELLQMAGRAGRRGYDDEGNCIILQNKYGRTQLSR